MAKTQWKGIPTHPGLAGVPGAERGQRVHPVQGQDGFMPGNIVALGSETITLMDINYINFYNLDWYTETKDGA